MNAPDVCPTCEKGRVADGVASMPNECCAIYFFGAHSWPHRQWCANQQRAPHAPK